MAGTKGYIQKSSPLEPRNLNPNSYINELNDIKGASFIVPYLQADDSGWGGDPNEAPSITDPGLLDIRPGRMKRGQSIKVLDYPSAGTDTIFTLERLPISSEYPFSLDQNDANYWGNFWAEQSRHLKETTRVYQYARSTPSGGIPPFPYTTLAGVAYEANWKNENNAADGNQWMRFRNTDVKVLADDGITMVFRDWTAPIPLGNVFERGDYVENRWKRQNINENQLTGGVDNLVTGKSYRALNQVVYNGVTYEEGRIFIAGATTTFTGTAREVVPIPPQTVNGVINNEPAGWFDTPGETGDLATNGTLWKIYAQKNVYGQLKSAWIGPFRINEDPNYIRYSKSASPHPDNIVSNKVSGDGQTTWTPTTEAATDGSNYDLELVANDWKQTDDGQAVFIATRQDDNGGSPGPPFSVWKVERIANESGEYIDRVFKLFDFNLDYDNAALQAPTIADATQQGWSDIPLPETDLQINFISEARKFFDRTLKTPWSKPVPFTSKDVFNDIIDSDHDSFKSDNAGGTIPTSITLTAKLFKGVVKLWEQSGITINFLWKKVYDNGTSVDVDPTTNPADDFYTLGENGTAGTTGYLFDKQRVVIKPDAVTGKAVFRCTMTLSMATGDDIVFEEEYDILDISDGLDAKDLTVKADNQILIYDTSGAVFNPPEVKLRGYSSNIGSPTLYWYRWNGSAWAAISAGGGYTISANTLTIDIATASLFTADGSAEEQRFALSTHATNPESADYSSTFSDYVTIAKLGSAGVGAPGQNSVLPVLDNEAENLILSTVTGEPVANEIGSSGRVKTTLQLWDGDTKKVYGAGNDYTIAVSPNSGDVQFAFQAAGNDVLIYVSQWQNPGTPIRSQNCTITVTYGAKTFPKQFSVSTSLDAPGAIILDIDSDKGFSFTPSDQTDKTLQAFVYDSNLGSAAQPANNYYFRWKKAGGAFTSWTQGDDDLTVTRADVLQSDNVTVQVSDDAGSTVLRERTIKVNDVVDGRTLILYYNYSQAVYDGLTEPFPAPSKPTGDYSSKPATGQNVWSKNAGQALSFWVSYGQYDLSGTIVWSNAQRVRGEAGGAGQEGNFFFFMYKQASSKPTFPNGNTSTLNQMTTAGWTATVPVNGPVWVTSRLWIGAGVTFDGNKLPSTGPATNSIWFEITKFSGTDGNPGVDADEVVIQYSANGVSGWGSTPNNYIRFSTDGGSTYGLAFKIKGEAGSNAPQVQIQWSANGTSGWGGTPDKYIRFSVDGGSTWSTAFLIQGLVQGIERYRHGQLFLDFFLTSSGSLWNYSAFVDRGVNPGSKKIRVEASIVVYNDNVDVLVMGIYASDSNPTSGSSEFAATPGLTIRKKMDGTYSSSEPYQKQIKAFMTTDKRFIHLVVRREQVSGGGGLRHGYADIEIFEGIS